MREAEDLLDDWIRNAVRTAQEEVVREDPRLADDDLSKINEINQTLKERGDGSIWGSVRYRLYTEETENGEEVVSIDTFGVPMIPPDIDVELDERTLRVYNDVLSDYGVRVSEEVEEQFHDWRSERREQA